ALLRAKPVFATLPGWQSDIRGITQYDDLPANAKAYVDFLEGQIGFPITLVSNGHSRNEITRRQP
ncbi:MAG: adenylosuccinate synthetase, partial [Oscillospiraceae bacterium]|nr:adenylosuccinate synthetase [Oscillospiraceae bacterium]